MCGIAGVVALHGGQVDLRVVQAMNDRQIHRGPDGEGFVVGWAEGGGFRSAFLQHTDEWDPRHAVRLALAHRRLAILDLSDRGLQPMSTCSSQEWIVFNGEIYNHRPLRAELEARGYGFASRTDTEVLLQAYRHWGEACLDHLDGMFGFAIWDPGRRRLFCARDRLGIKPFYYATPKGYFAFASEIKALVCVPGVDAEPDDDAVVGFLVHGNCDLRDRTIFRHVRALPAAHSLDLDVESGRLAIRQYWCLTPQAGAGGDEDRVRRLKGLLLGTTRTHLISDVRAGSCLSGGLDSSTVVSLIRRIWCEQPEAAAAIGDNLATFTSCYEDPELDERTYALSVADSVGAASHLVFPRPDEFWESFTRMTWHQDMPFGSLSFYAQWRVMQAARDAGVKVLLDGQGGDEVFGGYAKFRYAHLASLLRAGGLTKLVRELGAMVMQRDPYLLDLRKGYRYLPKGMRRLFRVDSLLQNILRADWDRAVSDDGTPAVRWWRWAAGANADESNWTLMQRIQADDIVIDTLPGLLRMEDRSSMAFSLEARVPLLDHRVVEYGISLPDHLKFQNGRSKFAMRQAMSGLMPDDVRLRRTKLGFAAPDRRWLAQDLRPQITGLIAENLRCSKYVDLAGLRRWYASSHSATANTESYLGLFRVLALEMWMDAFNVS
jgi:asparagine synthase (glutamine-hydrolysing)